MTGFLALIAIAVGLALAVVTVSWKQEQARARVKANRERLALRISPTYQQMLDAEHKRRMETRQLDLIEQVVYHGLSNGAEIKFKDVQVKIPNAGGRVEGISEVSPPQIAGPQIKQPTMRYLMNELEPGSLSVCPGVRLDTGQPVILSIEDAVHFKLIGSSGFGKSCLAAALLEQAITLNDPGLLQIALLDLEHKTSRLFEDSPNVAVLPVGRRSVPMVATSADEVATYLGYLKLELDRRARLSEMDLEREPIMLIYVEEMLSLQYEVDEKLLAQMLASLSILAVRARKYRMFLLACAQTDYSTPELKTAQKQFRTRIAFAIDTTSARAAGFMSTELIKTNFATSEKGGGQFVMETPGVASLMLAPVYDVRQKLLTKERSGRVQDVFTPRSIHVVNSDRTTSEHDLNTYEQASQADVQKSEDVRDLRSKGWGKIKIIEKVWNVKRGGSTAWQEAQAEYDLIVSSLEMEA